MSFLKGKNKISDRLKVKYRNVPFEDFDIITKEASIYKVYSNINKSKSKKSKSKKNKSNNKNKKTKSEKTGKSNSLDTYINKNLSTDEFMLKTIENTYLIIKKTTNKKQINISDFIKLCQESLQIYGITKSYDEVKEFYAHNVYKMNFKHVPSRDPSTFVALYTPSGSKRNFSYLSII